ncbi:MAG: AMP-binding protein [Clostridiales bacterium]|nr:AMP-binding protein [Clostridiales bacterium]
MTRNLTNYLDFTAARLPNKPAFDDGTERLTFSQLRVLARRVGSFVAQSVGKTGRPVAVITRHRVADIAAFFGILYAGCFYVPVDGDAGETFIHARMDAVQPALVIDAARLAELPLCEEDTATLAGIAAAHREADPACAIFTSGSTGLPKCALTGHRAIVDLTEWHTETFPHGEDSIYGNQTPFFFIASLKEIYLTVKNGATTHILPKELFARPAELLRRLTDLRVNTILWATAAFKLMANLDALAAHVPQDLQYIFFSGESVQGRHVNYWRRFLPEALYTNLYGLTETATNVAYYMVDRPLDDAENLPMGRARKNVQLYLLDGDPGEIAAGGACLAMGYWRNSEQTAALFVQNPLQNDFPETVYRTGDIARRNERGELVYVCRKDSQVKHMGVRVELGEVETAALGSALVRDAACAYDTQRDRIVIFYTGDAEETALRAALREKLPKYMQPKRIARLPALPQLPNGKTDRVRLHQMLKED